MTAPSPRRDYVVVVFGSHATNSHCDLSHCPMHAHGPYTREEAAQAVERMPAWMQPHILTLSGDDDACLRAAPGFVPRHETLSAEDFAVPAENPNPDNDWSPGA